jgi:hypothetical protein
MRADETMFCIGKSGQGSHCMDNRDGPFKGWGVRNWVQGGEEQNEKEVPVREQNALIRITIWRSYVFLCLFGAWMMDFHDFFFTIYIAGVEA